MQEVLDHSKHYYLFFGHASISVGDENERKPRPISNKWQTRRHQWAPDSDVDDDTASENTRP